MLRQDKRRVDMICVMIPILLTISRQEVSNFYISGSTEHRKVLKTRKGYIVRYPTRILGEKIVAMFFQTRHATSLVIS